MKYGELSRDQTIFDTEFGPQESIIHIRITVFLHIGHFHLFGMLHHKCCVIRSTAEECSLLMFAIRRSVFAKNVDYIGLHNLQAELGQHTFTLGINEYADLVSMMVDGCDRIVP